MDNKRFGYPMLQRIPKHRDRATQRNGCQARYDCKGKAELYDAPRRGNPNTTTQNVDKVCVLDILHACFLFIEFHNLHAGQYWKARYGLEVQLKNIAEHYPLHRPDDFYFLRWIEFNLCRYLGPLYRNRKLAA